MSVLGLVPNEEYTEVNLGNYIIHDSVSYTCHMVLCVVGSWKYSFSVHPEADVCIFCHVPLWLYILGEYMCVLLVLVLWCPVYSSTLVYDLECQNIFLLLLYPSCR